VRLQQLQFFGLRQNVDDVLCFAVDDDAVLALVLDLLER
jgi:hypothetical protein